jgi:cytochrome c oxidase assembly protein subunit 15
VAALLLTGYQGWLGGRVVAHELAPWIVTAHMLVALVIVQLLLWATVESFVGAQPAAMAASPSLRRFGWAAWAVTALLLVQVGVGTQVRGAVDIALATVPRSDVLAAVGAIDTWHRELGAVMALAVVGLWMWAWLQHGAHAPLRHAASAALAAVVVQIAAGMALAGFALPPPAQVVHLTVSTVLLGTLTALALVAWKWPAPSADAVRASHAA